MQQGDYSSSYYQYHHPPHLHYPNSNPSDLQTNPTPLTNYASAPPFAPSYSDYPPPNFPSVYNPSYSQKPDPLPPTAPSYAPPNFTINSNYQSFTPPSSSSNSAPERPAPFRGHPAPHPPYYSSYDQHQPPSSYAPLAPIPTNPNPIPISNPNPNLPFSSSNPNSYSHLDSSIPPIYEFQSPYESNVKSDNKSGSSYLHEGASRYGVQPPTSYNRDRFDSGMSFHERPEGGSLYDRSSIQDDILHEQNVYAYDGGKVEPYGARGTRGKSANFVAFDDYGRSLSASSKDQVGSNKVMKAVPKMEMQQDIKNGLQKFRVKLLAETGGQTTMDVLCQIGLDGIHMLDPTTGRTLRIYPLETITRSEVLDSSIFAFWSKSTVDTEPRRIRLKSSSYTTNTILDTVTAATIQLKEIGGKDSFGGSQSNLSKQPEQSSEKKKGFTDWVNLIKPGNEEKDHWVPDEAVTKCTSCCTDFGAFVRRHHCRNCGDIFCDKCTHGRIALTAEENAQPVRVCEGCLVEVTRRLSYAKQSSNKPRVVSSSHEELAKKLQEEMEKNCKVSSGSKSSGGSGRRMREVACPTCTVHLQVEVPSSGSETIECGVCQHPFLVTAH